MGKEETRKPAKLYLEEPLEFPTMAKSKLMPGIELVKHINRLFNLAFTDYFGAKLEINQDRTVGCTLYFKLGYDNGKNAKLTAFEKISLSSFKNDNSGSDEKPIRANWTSKMRMHNQIVKEFNCQNSIITQDAVDILYTLLDYRVAANPSLKPTPKSFKDRGICLETVFDSQNPIVQSKDVYNVVKFIDVSKVMHRLFCKESDRAHDFIVQPAYSMAVAANGLNRQMQNNPNAADIYNMNMPQITELSTAYEVTLYSKQELLESARATGRIVAPNPNGIVTDM